MLLLISFSAIFALGVTTSLAQEKTKIEGKILLVNTKYEVIKLDDIEGHVLVQHGWKGVDVVTGAQVFTSGSSDYVKGNGTHRTYSKMVDPDGDVSFNKAEGRTTTTLSPEGKPVTTIKGAFSFIRGTGKYENIHGGGKYKGKLIGPGILTYEWEGEYFIKK